MAPKNNAKGAAKGKGKDASEDAGAKGKGKGGLKAASSINVRHILVCHSQAHGGFRVQSKQAETSLVV